MLWYASYGSWSTIGYFIMGNYLATINNLSEPVTKTADKTMKVTYIIRKQLSEYVIEGIPRYLTIPASEKEQILIELDRVGINESFVYPELEHQTAYIKNRHTVKAGE